MQVLWKMLVKSHKHICYLNRMRVSLWKRQSRNLNPQLFSKSVVLSKTNGTPACTTKKLKIGSKLHEFCLLGIVWLSLTSKLSPIRHAHTTDLVVGLTLFKISAIFRLNHIPV